MNLGKKTVAVALVATLGLSLFVGLASAVTRTDPLTQILTLLQGIGTAVQDVDTKIDILTPNSIIIDKELTVDSVEGAGFMILPFVDGVTYSGTITLCITSGVSTTEVWTEVFVSELNVAVISKMDLNTPPVNTVFSGVGLGVRLFDSFTHQIRLKGVVTYTTTTQVTSLT